jgi:protein gp37
MHQRVAGVRTPVVAGRPGLAIYRSEPRWTGEVRFLPENLIEPLRVRKPQRWFVNSMSDLFHEKLPFEQIAAAFGIMAAAPRHTFQVLTKRPERMQEWFEWVARYGRAASPGAVVRSAAETVLREQVESGAIKEPWGRRGDLDKILPFSHRWPLPNVILGVTAEDQQRADERVPVLIATPATRRFISVEPQLEAVDLSRYLMAIDAQECGLDDDPLAAGLLQQAMYEGNASAPVLIHQVICGAESGPGARPFDDDWARALRDQCAKADVAFFLKQRLERGHKVSLPMLDGRQHVEQPR